MFNQLCNPLRDFLNNTEGNTDTTKTVVDVSVQVGVITSLVVSYMLFENFATILCDD